MSATDRTRSLTDELLALIDERVDQRVTAILRREAASTPTTEPWLDAKGAAAHLCWPVSRIYNATSRAGRPNAGPKHIPFHRDGSRVLFRASELDAWIQRGGNRRQAA